MNKQNNGIDYLSCLAGLADKYKLPEDISKVIKENDIEKAKELLDEYDKNSHKINLTDIIGSKASLVGVWGDGKHREVIFDPFRVIVNDKTEDTEAEVLVISDSLVYRITMGKNGNFNIEHSKINEIYDINGRKIKEQ
ncbi:MAG: hypothetical protein J6A59_13080 [Lachnospiraceae bacterium]|nr:hypothetical protein [Lachnospiraceae bacterium]